MSKTLKQKLVAYALVLPAFLVVMLTVAYPIVSAVIQSFQDEKTGEFTLANYAYFFTEPAQRMNILYTLFVVIATVVIALVVAYLLALYLRFVHSGIAKSIGTLYLLPRFVPAMCAVYAMITIIRDSGLINRIGLHFGMNLKLGLMYHANGMILMNLWFNIPFAAMMITAGLGAIPKTYYEAAQIDGASFWQRLKSITLPMLTGSIMINLVFGITYGLKVFDIIYVLTNGGPGHATEVVTTYSYQLYADGAYGMSTAFNTVLLILTAIAGIFVVKMMSKKEVQQ